MAEDVQSEDGATALPSRAQVVIIGGGIIGCSVAYHLTKLGWRDVVLLEKHKLTAGTTWHAAGLVVTGTFATETTVNMSKYSRGLYKRLGEETGQDTGFQEVGYLQIATSAERVDKLRRVADFVRGFDIDVQEISRDEVQKMWPLFETNDVICGFYTDDDGRANPVDVTMALAKGARMGGARLIEGVTVTGIKTKGGRATGVSTDQGDIEAEHVVNCGGMWAREIGKMAGVNVPLHAAEHYYLITEPMKGVHRDLPIVEDPNLHCYFRAEAGGQLMIGLFEPVASPWGMDGIPPNFNFGELPPDWDRMAPYLETAMARCPSSQDVGIQQFFCGPESFTPDMAPLVGPAPELEHFWVAAGFNSLGIIFGGGAGHILAQWMVDGLPPDDIREIDIDRMAPFQNSPKYLRDRTVEMVGWQYISWPGLAPTTARNARKSPMHDRLAEAGACFGTSAGWEWPNWFAPEGVEPKVHYSWGKTKSFDYVASEHQAAREGVVMLDMTHMAKFLVQGDDAEKVLNQICANDISVAPGQSVYTQWLNERGRIEADLTVTRLAEDCYFIVSGDVIHQHTESWLKRNTPKGSHLFVTDVTSGYTILNIQGPKSRELISSLTSADMANEVFPFRTMQEIDIGYAPVKALRISYVGELGWELYVPTEFTLHVFDQIVEAGKAFGLRHAGMSCLETLRLEKAYRDYCHDIDNMDTPLEVGLGFCVKMDKPGGFIGREALLKQKEAGITTRLVQFLVEDPEPMLHAEEPIYRNGERVGYIKAGGYGHTLGGAVGLGPVANPDGLTPVDYVKSGSYEIEISGKRYPARASLRPMYDPKSLRVRS